MGAAVGAVDHRVGFAGQFVVQPGADEAPEVGSLLGLRLLDEHSPLKSFMHRFDAVIGLGLIAAGAYFVWSRFKVYKQYKLEGVVPSKAD